VAVNDPNEGSRVRQPRAIVKANGVRLAVESVDVTNKAYAGADDFRVRLPLYGQSAEMTPRFWSRLTDAEFSIAVGFAQADGSLADLTTLVVGLPTRVDMDPMEGTLDITGRDYSAALIDQIESAVYVNATASEAVAKIADEHGLGKNITATGTPIGFYYGNPDDAAALTRQSSQWDFITGLAQVEGFIAFMQGRNLYFGPPPVLDRDNPFVLKAIVQANGVQSSNMKRLRLSRSLDMARDISVVVMSADRATGETVTGRAESTNPLRNAQSGPKVTGPLPYIRTIPNLTQGQATQRAQALLAQLTRHERVIEATMPGDPRATILTPIRLTGTSTDFDQSYFANEIWHRLDTRQGYQMTIRAMNASPYLTSPESPLATEPP
jgi:phage protein D